jgi:hypothetical protein
MTTVLSLADRLPALPACAFAATCATDATVIAFHGRRRRPVAELYNDAAVEQPVLLLAQSASFRHTRPCPPGTPEACGALKRSSRPASRSSSWRPFHSDNVVSMRR